MTPMGFGFPFLLLTALARVEAELSRLREERDALQHRIDCADTPLMRDVLADKLAAEARCARLQQALNVKRKDELIDGMVRFADDLEAGVIFVQDFPPELIRRLREALARSDTPADSHYRERPIEEDFYLDPRGEWVYRWSDERRVLKPAEAPE